MVVKNSEARECANTNRASIENNLAGNIDMNIVAKTEMNFHGINLTPVSDMSGIWLTSADVAKALHYNSTKSVTNLFNQYSDEFSPGMTMVIESVTNGINGTSRRMKVRVFSLRGAHLLAMFARTPVAKEFRRWVLDILDRQIEQLPLPASNHLINNLELICRTWDEAKEQITVFDPKMAQHLNGTMSMFWMYTMSMKGKGNKKGGVKNNQRYLQ